MTQDSNRNELFWILAESSPQVYVLKMDLPRAYAERELTCSSFQRHHFRLHKAKALFEALFQKHHKKNMLAD